jgi:hypothetical protein
MLGRMALPGKATYDDLLAVPEQLVAEIVDGELYKSPRPASPHVLAATSLTAQIGGAFGHGPSSTSSGR